MKKLSIAFLILLFTGSIPVSCCLDSCGCGGSSVKDFKIISMGVRTSDANGADVDEEQFHDFENVVKSIFVEEKEFVAFETQKSVGSFFATSAFACSPADPEAIQMLRQVKVISETDVFFENENDRIIDGEDISERFNIGSMHRFQFKSLDQFVTEQSPLWLSDEYQLILVNAPYHDTELVFTIEIELSDNTSFQFENQTLRVNGP
jgi:hypothetical protein